MYSVVMFITQIIITKTEMSLKKYYNIHYQEHQINKSLINRKLFQTGNYTVLFFLKEQEILQPPYKYVPFFHIYGMSLEVLT